MLFFSFRLYVFCFNLLQPRDTVWENEAFVNVKPLRPLDQPERDTFDASPYITDLFTCTIKRLKAADIDQEVKERAISCMGQIICNLGDSLGDDLPGTLHIFLERLKNEITRLTTVKALTLIAGWEGMMLESIRPIFRIC